MPSSIKVMNKNLYRSAFHLNEAAKYLSNVSEFQEEANRIFEMAYEMVSIIQPEQEKVSEDKMQSILDEIINFDDDEEEDADHGN